MAILKFRYNEAAVAPYRKFKQDECLEFVIEDTWESRDGASFTLLCRVLTGDDVGKLTRMSFDFLMKDGKPNGGTLSFLKAIFTDEQLQNGFDLQHLLDKRFSCVSKIRTGKTGLPFQNFDHIKLIETGGAY